MDKKRELINDILYGTIPLTSGACLWHSGTIKILEEVLSELSLKRLKYIVDEQIQFVYVLKGQPGTIEEFPINGFGGGEKLRVIIIHNLEGKSKREVKKDIREVVAFIFRKWVCAICGATLRWSEEEIRNHLDEHGVTGWEREKLIYKEAYTGILDS